MPSALFPLQAGDRKIGRNVEAARVKIEREKAEGLFKTFFFVKVLDKCSVKSRTEKAAHSGTRIVAVRTRSAPRNDTSGLEEQLGASNFE